MTEITTIDTSIAKAPFEYLVLDIKVCGTDAKTNKVAVLIVLMDAYTNIVFHTQYTTQTGQSVLVKFLRLIVNKHNFGNLNIKYKIITAFDKPFEPVINSFLSDNSEIIFNPELSNKIVDKVREKYVSYT